MSAAALVAVAAALCFASFVQAITGFGFALLSMPLMTLVINTKDAVAVASLVALLASTLLLARSRHHVNWMLVKPMVGGAVLGMPVGLVVLIVIDEALLKLLVAGAVLGFVVVLSRGWQLRSGRRVVDVAAGFVSGVLNTSVSTNGPPLVLALQARGLDPETFRGTISATFVASSLVGNTLLAGAGRVTTTVLAYAAVGPPALLLGNVVGSRVGRQLPARRFRSAVLGLLVLAAVSASVSALAG